ncbi:MAG: hypothetical protein HPY52_11035 [Firmicutes bacterium]|nr:hypothetical protein [Bacillota bacterium]
MANKVARFSDPNLERQVVELVRGINASIPSTEKGQPNGVATLDSNGKVPANQADAVPTTGGAMSGELSIKNVPVYERLEHIPALILGNEDWTPLIYAASAGMPVYSAADRGVLVSGISNWIKVRVRMPVDPESLYFVRAKVKKKSGDGTFFIGAVSLDENYNELSTDLAMSYNYFGASNVSIPAGSVYYAEGIISGYNATTEGNPNKFDPEAKFFDLIIICNYYGTVTPTETVIGWLELYKAPNTAYSGPLTIRGNEGASPNAGQLRIKGVSANTGIELGRTDGVASLSYIDFHTGAAVVDYDSRIIASGGNGVSGGGTLNIECTNLMKNSFSVWHAGNANIAWLTGTISQSGTIPLPSGFTEAECLWGAEWIYAVDPETTLDFGGFRIDWSGRTVTLYRMDGGVWKSDANCRVRYWILGIKKP